ncbi:ring-cleaving dioxygenase [Thiohalobacter sp. COW1]|uniref:Lactoylglutathione lyase n=1 Tax=Thiohalobacter thiocyanaticus TaxID=585455 RepID=A0A1Z4VV86_9GAMM|nr:MULTISPECIES: VOC family protein [Thiohalobacter]BAZ95288.1 lactoylglutathione lyase [Thiohalobacter thiocyanaticus]BCO32759.1 ring-cleaving dioxygenase [Thiohalobacter sp. COW1]
MTQRPPATLGLRHVALYANDLDASLHFYRDLLGMELEWQPDADNVYLSSAGQDNLALHREAGKGGGETRLDHIGFILRRAQDVDAWHDFLVANGVVIKAAPRTHRDGARSFYCADPEGNIVQMIYHPPIAGNVT